MRLSLSQLQVRYLSMIMIFSNANASLSKHGFLSMTGYMSTLILSTFSCHLRLSYRLSYNISTSHPEFLFSAHGGWSFVILWLHLASSILAICPTKRHLAFSIVIIICSRFVLCLIHSVGFLSVTLMFYITLTMQRCVVWSLFIHFLVITQLSVPYLRTGITYRNIFIFM